MTLTLPARTETIRRLATIERIESIRDIPDADAIVCARVRGWDVVVKSGDFVAGDLCLYVEIDSLIPTADPRFDFLAPRGVRTDPEGNTGHVLKTAKLRGQYSQGLALGLAEFPEFTDAFIGSDVTRDLGIVKWDPPIPAELAGNVRGVFPAWIPKTDEERIQNNGAIIGTPGNWVATEKIDGISMTAWTLREDFGVAQRNYDLQESDNLLWATARQLGLHEILRTLGESAAVQGELFGPSLPSNRLGQKSVQFRAFTVFVDGAELPRSEWPAELLAIAVPIYDLVLPATVEAAVDQVDGLRSLVNPERAAEGVVWRNMTDTTIEVDGYRQRASAKVISRKYLAKHQDS
ncbi:RNA ligase (ATP) (plasmid) [Glaciihabitans sp. INWT7]|uniref:RNA ligase (ATP) n=1 Tax=Glaciihabitans sp. INWT7 TaxID=2596912 RepID=UPI001626109A|nr:RNA ligase (ATP) [Glaciihabitans sp. INWT7]QNE48691.1 RNA ligase (ATP) [Glaciihabitans sp. INWT7]